LASPAATLQAAESASGVVAIANERAAIAIVVGLPLSLSGAEGPAAAKARSYAARLVKALAQSRGSGQEALPVYLVDERFTTVSASAALRSAGHDSRSARRVVDQAAATALLQGVLDAASAQRLSPLVVLETIGQQVVVPPPGNTADNGDDANDDDQL
jgi:putative Holliday junction resolvase